MNALLRNPLYHFLSRVWWVPVLIGVAVAATGQPALQQAALAFGGLGLGGLLAATLTAWLHGMRERRRARELAADERHRFLCPECLCFGDPAYACGACEKECEAFIADSGGGYVNDCRHCEATLLPPEREGAVGLLAYCRLCGATTDRRPHHERRVCKVGVLRPAELAYFVRLASPECAVTQTAAGVRLDDGAWLTYVLDLSALSPASIAREHAARQLDALWLAAGEERPLELGEQLDAFIRRTRLSAATRTQLKICLGGSREALPRDALNVLQGRFPNSHKLEFGVSPAALIERLTTRSDREAGRKPPRVLAVLDGADWETLRQVRDSYGAPLVHPDGWFRQPGGLTVRLYNLEVLRAGRHESPAELVGLEAVWLSGTGDRTHAAGEIEELARLAHLSTRQQERLIICIEEPQPSAWLRNALQSRFRLVRSGVSAEEFLWHGRGARAPALPECPTHVLATCLPGDFETLFREMDSLQRERLGTAWVVEETGDRTSFVVELGDPARLPGSFSATPALGEVQAVWLGESLPDPLELAERLDGLIRGVWGSETRRDELVVCVWSASPEPAIRNLLEARFGAVRYGVTAREFIEHGARTAERSRMLYEDTDEVDPVLLRSSD